MMENAAALKIYPASCHRVLMCQGAWAAQEVDAVLAQFGARVDVVRQQLVKFMSGDEEKAERETFRGGGLARSAGGMEALQKLKTRRKWANDERILGTGTFVESLLQRTKRISRKQ